MKTHPKPEEWMSFLYREASPERSTELEAHLHQCRDCQRSVAQWRGSMALLDGWRTPTAGHRRRTSAPMLRWAAAAVLVLSIGVAVGRMTSPSTADFRRLETTLRTEMETKLATSRTELAAVFEKRNAELSANVQSLATAAATREAEALLVKFAKSMDDQRIAEHDVYVTALRNLEERRATEYALLRKDLDTLAVNADDGLSRTQEQLMELASLAQPPSN